jgi:PAS domain S-box-containing protein
MLGAVVNITEVTEQRAQRDTLRTHSRILETMREGVVLVDAANMVIRLTNPTFDRLFGYRTGELIGQSVEPLISLPGTQRKRFERGLREHNRLRAAPVELECIRQDHTRFVASCVLSPLSMGGTDHWLAVIHDVTERKRLERGIIEIANREQQRIGSDLHDGLGQELTGIALMLRGVVAQLTKEKSSARLDVEDVIGLVNHAIENTRSLARGLTPVSAQSGGLAAALRALAERASQRYGVRVEFRDNVGTPLKLNETYGTHLYRIAQEALTNVVRHSLASEVAICVEVVGDELQLRVDDNGRGFTHQPDGAAGLGLKMMRYRAQMLGGDLVLETSANGGASVRCSCPLEP